MKKKIILFLSVLLVAMFLTGCSTTTNPEALEKSNEVASEIAKKHLEGRVSNIKQRGGISSFYG